MASDPQTERSRAPSSPHTEDATRNQSWLSLIVAEAPASIQWRVSGGLARGELLWILVVIGMALDVALTGVGLTLGLEERNPVALALIERLGVLGAGVVLKGLVLGVGVAYWLLLPRLFPSQHDRRYLIPLALALPSWAVVGFNAVLVLSVL